MSKNLLYEAKIALSAMKKLNREINLLCEQFSIYEGYILKVSSSRKTSRRYYSLKKRGVKGRKYLGSESNKEVNNIRDARYYEELLRVTDKNVQLLESVVNEYVIPDFDSINKRLPKVYRKTTLPDANAILINTSDIFNNSNFAPSDVRTPLDKAAEWKRRKEKEKAKYEPYRPEDLVHAASDGTMMRSASEVIIANYLISQGITFVYELPLLHHGKMILPDFTILSPVDNKTEIIIEHQGAMTSESYHTKFIKTLLFYLQTKLVPNRDVFFTFNHLDNNLDIRQIDSILHMAFGYEMNNAAA